MSLIDEALKRARLEAAQRAAESEGLPYPTIPRHLAPRRPRRWLAPVAVTLAVVAGLAFGLLLASRDTPQPDRGVLGGGQAAAEPVTSGPAAPAELVRDGTLGDGIPGDGPPPRVSPPATSPPEPSIEPKIPAVEPAMPPAAAAAADPAPAFPQPNAQPAPPATSTVTDPDSGVLLVLPQRPAPGAAATGAAPGPGTPVESHVQRFALPDGGAVELGGIAWSESGPFALINGRVVGPGSVIGDYTLERIQPGHIELAGDGRRIHLSLQ